MRRRAFIAAAAAGSAGLAVVPLTGQGRGQARKAERRQLTEFKQQYRKALKKMLGNEHDPTLLIAVLQLQAAAIEDTDLDALLQQAAQKQGRRPREANHTEMEQMLKDLGGDELPFALSVHTADDPKFDGLAYESLLRGQGLAAKLRATAAFLETESKKWPHNGILTAQGTTVYFDRGTCPVCIAADGLSAERNYICGIAALLTAAGVPEAMSACWTITAIWAAHASACYLAAVFGC